MSKKWQANGCQWYTSLENVQPILNIRTFVHCFIEKTYTTGNSTVLGFGNCFESITRHNGWTLL